MPHNAAMRMLKLAGLGVLLLVIALGSGYWWGASGRAVAQDALDGVQQRLDLAEARGHILEARVSLYNVNFGDAQRQLDDAKASLTRARDRAQAAGRKESADALSAALGHAQEAQRLAGRLDQNANSRANEALKAIETASK
jgi:Tar ligand binding domain homologue